VYSTVDEGFIVSQDFSFDCESLRCCVVSVTCKITGIGTSST
jgi:hypothetical protein